MEGARFLETGEIEASKFPIRRMLIDLAKTITAPGCRRWSKRVCFDDQGGIFRIRIRIDVLRSDYERSFLLVGAWAFGGRSYWGRNIIWRRSIA